ncbi:MAG: ABC transporter ATP-binding protein [Deltaproteobacteria bacterium GWA2_38_16]|nr:MAG: ABC transporter ATP-binding protein [Deltaproteobacteria bacterium GWA2_38_16]OGQ03765.1 MAG: ABC transporter ATP-binding protein [Deltaproteobacteria bacterium RIFCSPHIGHO2_02_FULL_38_15]OGQ33289.1 MAG: ABC transporter ATP-binding protein [Deltaproteobacteria bacterium RIFCSPLOWO2_01_FULL_38_9]OGQ60699.1 MAG: ABC transporter ATP-binding protein [Deltaproteobacteria bacterium RIFCSPLOWO2_12_FULL_38_8]HBQ21327.1 ABC transporter ATP-binding protein [Deltaproteobacteria bacterium]
MSALLKVQNLSHVYGERKALSNVSFQVEEAKMVGFLGPNGGGKTTLFRILSTFLTPNGGGEITVGGWDCLKESNEVRKLLGVVFQHPSLDKKLTVKENLIHQGHLYGLWGENLTQRIEEVLGAVKLKDREHELVEKLSGGLQRRVEIAKGLLHHPQILLLDEPTTGLDPAARIDIWAYLKQLKEEKGVTCLVTTHLIEEAERCDVVGILDQGKLIAFDTPNHLKKEIGGEVIILKSTQCDILKASLEKEFQVTVLRMDQELRIEKENASEFLMKVMKSFPELIDAATLSKPSLENVFVHKTGHTFLEENR